MRVLCIAGCFVLSLAACSSGTTIKDLPNQGVSKTPATWKDPGATPDLPRDAGMTALDGGSDAGTEAGAPVDDAGGPTLDAGVTDGGPEGGAALDAQVSEAGAPDAGAPDAG